MGQRLPKDFHRLPLPIKASLAPLPIKASLAPLPSHPSPKFIDKVYRDSAPSFYMFKNRGGRPCARARARAHPPSDDSVLRRRRIHKFSFSKVWYFFLSIKSHLIV